MAPHSSILAWKIPRTEKLGRLQSMGLQSRVSAELPQAAGPSPRAPKVAEARSPGPPKRGLRGPRSPQCPCLERSGPPFVRYPPPRAGAPSPRPHSPVPGRPPGPGSLRRSDRCGRREGARSSHAGSAARPSASGAGGPGSWARGRRIRPPRLLIPGLNSDS